MIDVFAQDVDRKCNVCDPDLGGGVLFERLVYLFRDIDQLDEHLHDALVANIDEGQRLSLEIEIRSTTIDYSAYIEASVNTASTADCTAFVECATKIGMDLNRRLNGVSLHNPSLSVLDLLRDLSEDLPTDMPEIDWDGTHGRPYQPAEHDATADVPNSTPEDLDGDVPARDTRNAHDPGRGSVTGIWTFPALSFR